MEEPFCFPNISSKSPCYLSSAAEWCILFLSALEKGDADSGNVLIGHLEVCCKLVRPCCVELRYGTVLGTLSFH